MQQMSAYKVAVLSSQLFVLSGHVVLVVSSYLMMASGILFQRQGPQISFNIFS